MQANVHIPMLPNFLTITVGRTEVKIGVEDLSDAALAQVANKWGDALIEHARKRRKTKKEATDGR